jgi:lipoprotein-releasing system ATP-binding protein
MSDAINKAANDAVSEAIDETISQEKTTNQPVIECRNLHKSFADSGLDVDVINGINLTIGAGEQLAIMGSSGSGKSTLLHLLGGLDVCTEGEVLINGENFSQLNEKERGLVRNRNLGFIYQFHHLLPEFSALENVALPLLIRGDEVDYAAEQASKMLGKVGLDKRMKHKPGELSGGERQRTAVARALITKPSCILADEPTGNLDHKTAEVIYDLIIQLNEELSTSIIMVTHDARLADRMQNTLMLEDGKFVKN